MAEAPPTWDTTVATPTWETTTDQPPGTVDLTAPDNDAQGAVTPAFFERQKMLRELGGLTAKNQDVKADVSKMQQETANPWAVASTPHTQVIPGVETAVNRAKEYYGSMAADQNIPTWGRVAAGIDKGAIGAAESFTSPLGIAAITWEAPMAIKRLLGAAFAAMGAKQGGEAAGELVQAVKDKDWGKAAELATEVVGSGVQVAAGTHGAVEGGFKKAGADVKDFAGSVKDLKDLPQLMSRNKAPVETPVETYTPGQVPPDVQVATQGQLGLGKMPAEPPPAPADVRQSLNLRDMRDELPPVPPDVAIASKAAPQAAAAAQEVIEAKPPPAEGGNPVEAPAADKPAPTSDFDRYQELVKSLDGIRAAARKGDLSGFNKMAEIQKEMEVIKNRNPEKPGYPPEDTALKSEAVKEINRIASLPNEDFRKEFSGGGKGSSAVDKIVDQIKTPAEAEAIKKAHDEVQSKFQDAVKKAEAPGATDADIQTMSDLGSKQSLFGEAYKAAQKKVAAMVKPESPIQPAVKAGETVVTGGNHDAAAAKLPEGAGKTEDDFLKDGKFINREEAAKETGIPTTTEPGKLHSEDVAKAQYKTPKGQIEIKIKNPYGLAREGEKIQTFTGTLFKIDDVPEHDFVVYKTGKGWRSVEKLSGQSPGDTYGKTRAESIAKAKESVKKVGADMMKLAISRAEKINQGEPNAIPIGKPAEIPVGQPPQNSGEVGARVPQPEAPAQAQAKEVQKPAPGEAPPAEVPLAPDAAKKVDDFLSSLKLTKPGRVLEGVTGLPAVVWDASIDVIRHLVKGGFALKDAIEQGLKWIKENHPDAKFDENEYRKQFEQKEEPKAGAGETYGISQRMLDQRAARGDIDPIAPGKGISAEGSVKQGQQILKDGADPEQIMTDFEETKRVSGKDIAVARAHGEQLEKTAKEALAKYGKDSEEYAWAWKADLDWSQRMKAMSTEWHKIGQAQQGETDLDTGDFHSLRKAFNETTGKDFTPKQKNEAERKATGVKKASEEAQSAEKKLADELSKEPGLTIPNQSPADKAALEAVHKWHQDNAVRLAKAERKLMVTDAAEKQAAKDLEKAKADAFQKSRDKATRDEASELAVKKAQEAVTRAQQAKKAAQIERDTEARAAESVAKRLRDNAAKAAKEEARLQNSPRARVMEAVKKYIAGGMDGFDDIRNKVAADLGMKVEEVTRIMGSNAKAKRLMDDVWEKQQKERNVKEQAKRWLTDQALPGYQRALSAIPRTMFGLKVGFHGTVALGTHAPMLAFQPRFWATYARDFAKMYKMVGSPKYYEMQIQDLQRRPNYIRARRAGLVNDPASYEDFNNPKVSEYFGRLSGMGNRGYSVLKILRQDMFDQTWSTLPKHLQTDKMAELTADSINHVTGVVKGKAPKGSNVALFAPRLMASRAAWLAADPMKAAATLADWKNASPEQKQFALSQVKEKAWVMGTVMALLAANQGILSATGSKQKINFDDPMKSDFLKFKGAGMDVSYGNPMLTMARLPLRIGSVAFGPGGKLKNVIYPDETAYTVAGEYARSQLSPFASLLTDQITRSDWMGRQLPNSNRPEPARLRREGIKPYTWGEYLTQEGLPIPAEEAAKEVWKNGLGMSDEQIAKTAKAFATIAFQAGTGARVSEDYQLKKDAGKAPAPQ